MIWTQETQCDPEAWRLWTELQNPEISETDRVRVNSQLMAFLRSDFPTFCALLLKVKPKGGGQVRPFVWFNVQRVVWDKMVQQMQAGKPPFLVILKARQFGISTFSCAWIFWQVWRQRDITTLVISHQKKTNETMISTMRVFYDELPPAVRPKQREGSRGNTLPRGELYFATDALGHPQRSEVLLHLAEDLDPRGQQSTHVLETEFSSYPNAAELNGALLPQLPPRGSEARLRCSFIVESTPKGQNAFYAYYQDGKSPDSDWTSVFLPWFVHEEEYSLGLSEEISLTEDERVWQRELSRRRQEIEGKDVTDEQMYFARKIIQDDYKGDRDRFDQEYPSDDVSCFLLMSESLFKDDMRYLSDCCHTAEERAIAAWKLEGHDVTRAPRARLKWQEDKRRTKYDLDPQANWTIWEPPVEGKLYAIGADVCEGLGNAGNDNSTAFVIDVENGRQVAEFCANLRPETFSDELNAGGRWYNNALLCNEINKLGYVVLRRLLAHHSYPNMYRWPKWDEANAYTKKRGWESNPRTKLLAMSALVGYIEEREVEIASYALLAEITTFERVGEYFGAKSGKHDDRVIAMALALMAVEQTPKLAARYNVKRRMPSTRELGISAAGPVEEKPLPEAIMKLANAKYTVPWDPMGSEAMFS